MPHNENEDTVRSTENIKQHRSIREILRHNAGLKILSVVFAILLWCYVVSQTNPIRSITYNDIQINITGMGELTSQRLIPLEALRASLPGVRVTLNVPYRELSGVSSAVADVSLDLSGITAPGKYTVPLRVKSGSSDITVSSFSPSSVEIEIEELASAVVPVSLRTTGTLPDDLYKGEASLSPETLQISGPSSYISRIIQAQITVDLSLMRDGYAASMQYEYIDKNGNTVKSANITADKDAVLVDMGILCKKTVPVEYAGGLKNTDKLITGYELTGISPENSAVTVVGREQALKNIDRIYIRDIDLTGAGPELTSLKAELIQPDGVTILESLQQNVNITVSEKHVSRQYTVKISFINNAGRAVTASLDTARVTVSGGYFALENIGADNITVFADTTSLAPGQHDVRLSAMLTNGNPLVTVDVSPETVSVHISD